MYIRAPHVCYIMKLKVVDYDLVCFLLLSNTAAIPGKKSVSEFPCCCASFLSVYESFLAVSF